jgi:hypothetical protein
MAIPSSHFVHPFCPSIHSIRPSILSIISFFHPSILLVGWWCAASQGGKENKTKT